MTKCATVLAVCVALLSGYSTPAPTVVSVKCTDFKYWGFPIDGRGYRYYETYYWSDGTKTYKGLKTEF